MVRHRVSRQPSRSVCERVCVRECVRARVRTAWLTLGEICAQVLGEEWRSKHLPHHPNNPSLLLPPYL